MKSISKKIISFFLFSFFIFFACKNKANEELILYDFETKAFFDQVHWKCRTLFHLSDSYAVSGKKSLKLDLFPSSYPGFSPALAHNDWRGYQFFGFEVYNPGAEPFKLTVRIDDQKNANDYNDRYNKSFVILPGANTISIPLNDLITSGTKRALDLKNIYRFLIFMVHPKEKHTLYLDYFRLRLFRGHHT